MQCPNCGSDDVEPFDRFGMRSDEPQVCYNCEWTRSDDPDAEQFGIIVERVPFAECSDCGGNVVVRVWGEGIDSEVFCETCDNKEIYR